MNRSFGLLVVFLVGEGAAIARIGAVLVERPLTKNKDVAARFLAKGGRSDVGALELTPIGKAKLLRAIEQFLGRDISHMSLQWRGPTTRAALLNHVDPPQGLSGLIPKTWLTEILGQTGLWLLHKQTGALIWFQFDMTPFDLLSGPVLSNHTIPVENEAARLWILDRVFAKARRNDMTAVHTASIFAPYEEPLNHGLMFFHRDRYSDEIVADYVRRLAGLIDSTRQTLSSLQNDLNRGWHGFGASMVFDEKKTRTNKTGWKKPGFHPATVANKEKTKLGWIPRVSILAHADDRTLDQILNVRRAAFISSDHSQSSGMKAFYDERLTLDGLKQDVATPGYLLFIAIHPITEEVIGTVGLRLDQTPAQLQRPLIGEFIPKPGHFWIEKVAVHPQYQGSSVAIDMVRSALMTAYKIGQGEGTAELFAGKNWVSWQKIFEPLGFRPVEEAEGLPSDQRAWVAKLPLESLFENMSSQPRHGSERVPDVLELILDQ